LPGYTLTKTQDPALSAQEIGPLDAILLSHDHHRDNLDDRGRELLPRAAVVLTTRDGADRLGANAVGLDPWDRLELQSGGAVTAAPARHGPEGGDRGPAIGFVLENDETLYFTGDSVWYEGVADVLARFRLTTALVNVGAAKVAPAGDQPLTMTAAGAVELARALPDATLVALHFEGWKHFTEARSDVEAAFSAAGLPDRLVWPPPGEPIEI
jgi:L-ascorbate metabolism protein UlaG (beta-lactamase superfamily)